MKKKTIVNIDLVVQVILFLPIFVTFLLGFTEDDYFLITLGLMFFLGIWQIAFSVIYTLSYKDYQRSKHLGMVAAYFVIFPIIYILINNWNPNWSAYVTRIAAIFALAMGIWCLLLTYQSRNSTVIQPRPEMPEILDDVNDQSK